MASWLFTYASVSLVLRLHCEQSLDILLVASVFPLHWIFCRFLRKIFFQGINLGFPRPSIAQLVERRTVDCVRTSLGRWFESGSKDLFLTHGFLHSLVYSYQVIPWLHYKQSLDILNRIN